MILSVSIDLDPLWCYREIYGLGQSEEDRSSDPVSQVATERFCELADSLGLCGTLFVVGRVLENSSASAAVRQAHARGHEVANHTFSHRYDLSRCAPEVIRAEISKGAAAIEEVCGVKPRGFRAPGYLLGSSVLKQAAAAGAVYDSSVLPSPVYQGIKAAAVSVLGLMRRPTGAVLGDPREAFSPTRPYRPDPARPWKRGPGPLLELPISSVLGVPLIGSVLVAAGARLVPYLAAVAARAGFVNLELHGVDLMDQDADGLDPALGIQRDLKVPWEKKAEIISIFVRTLLQTHRCMPLREAAALLSSC
jgi:hypothetical protein